MVWTWGYTWRPTRSIFTMVVVGTFGLACGFDSGGAGSGSGQAPTEPPVGSSTTGPGQTGITPGVSTTDGTGDETVTNADTSTTGPIDPDTTGTGTSEGTGTDSDTSSGTTACMMVPWYLDDDEDGFGDPDREVLACDQPADHVDNAMDCNDDEMAINPLAVETCDGEDNDCDEITDEGSALNHTCNNCVFLLSSDASRYFAVCSETGTWDQSRTACITDFGLDAELAIIDNDTDQIALLGLIANQDHWLSLNDLVQADLWVWHDGTVAYMDGAPVGYDGWRFDQPISDDGAHCGELDPNGWADSHCAQLQPRICEHPI